MSDLQATDSSGSMQLVVLGCGREPTYIPISSTTRLEELMLLWYKETRTIPDTMVFLYKGREIVESDTPELLGMQDYDSIEIRSAKDSKTVDDAVDDRSNNHWNREVTLQPEMVELGIRFNGGHARFFEVVSTDRLSLLFATWSRHTRRSLDGMIFAFRGVKILGQSTPKFLNMNEGAVIDAYRWSSPVMEGTSSRAHVNITIIMDPIFHSSGPLKVIISRRATLEKLHSIIARMTGRRGGEFQITHANKEGRISYHKTIEQLKIKNGDKLMLRWRSSKAS